jgi:TolB-like protein
MTIPARRTVYRFGAFVLDPGNESLRTTGGASISLRPKSFALLRLMVENAGQLLARQTIMEALWPNIFVTDDNITQCVHDVRCALGDNGEQQRLIRTIIGKGIRFIGEVTEVSGATVPSPENQDVRAPSGAEKPSIAVLPFQNIGSDAEQEEFLAYGIAEDIITALSRYPSIFVIARNSCFAYEGRAIDVKRVGRELGVRYILEGSLRKAGNRIRVTAQLLDAEAANHI